VLGQRGLGAGLIALVAGDEGYLKKSE